MAEKDPTLVDANQRYASATQETVARITARDLAVAGYVTFAGTLITVAGSQHDYRWISVSVGYIALAAALLSCHHDIIIGQLGLFQCELCKRDGLDNWFSGKRFDSTLKARRLRDYYFGFLIATGVAMGLAISFGPMINIHLRPYNSVQLVKAVMWIASLVSGVLSLGFIHFSYRQRLSLHAEMHRLCGTQTLSASSSGASSAQSDDQSGGTGRTEPLVPNQMPISTK